MRFKSVKLPGLSIYGIAKSIPSEVLLGKGVLKICSKFTGQHPCCNHTSAWVFSCKFAAYFKNTFS